MNTGGLSDGHYNFGVSSYQDIEMDFVDNTNGWKIIMVSTSGTVNDFGYNTFTYGNYAHFRKEFLTASGFVQGRWNYANDVQAIATLNDAGLGSCSISCERYETSTGKTYFASSDIVTACSSKTPVFFTYNANSAGLTGTWCGFNSAAYNAVGNVEVVSLTSWNVYMDVMYASYITSSPSLYMYHQHPSNSVVYSGVLNTINPINPPKPGPTQACANFTSAGTLYYQGACP